MALRGVGTEFHDTTISVNSVDQRTFGQETDSEYDVDLSTSATENIDIQGFPSTGAAAGSTTTITILNFNKAFKADYEFQCAVTCTKEGDIVGDPSPYVEFKWNGKTFGGGEKTVKNGSVKIFDGSRFDIDPTDTKVKAVVSASDPPRFTVAGGYRVYNLDKASISTDYTINGVDKTA